MSSSEPKKSHRKYDIIVFGATGYTGSLVAEQLRLLSPSNLRWAIAGRSTQKLELLQNDLNQRNPDRTPVDTFICDLSEHQIETMASLTKCLITTVGPFFNYGTAVIEACAVYGTHYVDSTGEYPWVLEMIKRCNRTAISKKAIMIPQCGFDSAPIDLGTYLLVKEIRDNTGTGVADCTLAITDSSIGISGGTYETTINLFDHVTLQELSAASEHDALSPVKPGPKQPFSWPIKYHKDLGILTTWLNFVTDRSQVFRTWGLIDKGEYYGRNFVWNEYKRANNIVSALFYVVLFNIVKFFFVFGPFRWLGRKMRQHAPGEGHSEEARKANYAKWQGVATADEDVANPRKAQISISGPDAYDQTAIFMALTALAILYDENTLARKIGGGILTPATLATPQFFRELEKAGITFEVKMM